MRNLYFILFISLMGTISQAQINKGKKYLSKDEYDLAIEAFENDLEKPLNKPVALEQLAHIYLDPKYKDADIAKAYKYFERAIADLNSLSSKDRKKLQNKGISKMAMSKKMKDIITLEIKKVEREQSIKLANDFLEKYKDNSNNSQIKKICTWRNTWAYEKAKKGATYKSFQELFEKYEISLMEYNPDLHYAAQKNMLETYIAENGWAMYPTFEEKYSDNPYVKQQKEAYELIKIYRKRNIKNMNAYIEAYPNSLYVKFAKQYLHEQTMASPNLPDYDYFVRSYPDYQDKGEIWRRFYKLYINEHGKESVLDFVKTYDNYPFQDEIKEDFEAAKIHKERPIFEAALESKKSTLLIDFIKKNPNSSFIKDAEKPLVEMLQKDGKFRDFQFFLKKYPTSKDYDLILDKLYSEYTKDGELTSLNQFMIEHPEYKNEDRLKEDLKVAYQGAKINLTTSYSTINKREFEEYIRAAAPKERAFVTLQRMVEAEILEKNWALAIAKLEKFESYFAGNPKVANLKQLLQQKNLEIQKVNLGPNVNTATDEYVPIISVNDKQLYFCRWDNTNENIYVSEQEGNTWGLAKYIEGLNIDEPRENEGPLSISADNTEIIVFKNGDLYSAEKTIGGWQEIKPFPNTVNTNKWEADAMICSDGKTMFFSSKRPDLLDSDVDDPRGFHGDGAGNADLFVSIRKENGSWLPPVNLGSVINTPFLERTPFLHPDMKTLYFSSDGHGGFGRMDVYKSTRLDDSWTNWTTPINLGKSINTPENDWGYKVSTNGETAYFAFKESAAQGQDLYKITLPESLRPEKVSIISGQLKDLNNEPVFAEIIWEDLETGKEVGRLKSDPTTGDFYITLPNDKKYSYYIQKKGYFPKANHIDLKDKKGGINIKESLSLIKITEMVENGATTPLKNLFFDPNKFEIKPSSFLELNRLAVIIKNYNLKTEISGHTDSNGNDNTNLLLSQNRAKAVKDYLIEQGCNPEKITAEGYGEKKPVGNNKTEEGRQINRRVEVRFNK